MSAWPRPPKWLVEAFTPANQWIDDEAWNDCLELFWDALLDKGRVCHLDCMADPRDDDNPIGAVGLLMTKRPKDVALFRPVMAIPLDPEPA